MLEISSRAADQLISLLEDGQVVNVGIRGGGCGGFEYLLSIGPEQDQQTIISGVPVAIDPRAEPFLTVAELDYLPGDGLEPGGFRFANQAFTSCGCGKSFGR